MDNDGATPRELLFEACRRNNTTLLSDLLAGPPFASKAPTIADFLNKTTDSLGASALHVAAQYGSYEILDLLLDQEGVEIDGKEKRDGDTALHRAARFCNGLTQEQWTDEGKAIFDILLDAGCDPRIRNNAKLTPSRLLDPRNEPCKDALRQAEMTLLAGDDIVQADENGVDDAGSQSD